MHNTLTPLVALMFLAILALLAFAIQLHRQKPAFTYQQTPLLTANETEFYGRLRQALPWACVLPQTAMCALIQPHSKPSKKERLSAFRTISQKRIDFVICHEDLRVVCVIELDDSTHRKSQDRQRDLLLKSAGITTLRYESRASLRPTPLTIQHDVQSLLDNTDLKK